MLLPGETNSKRRLSIPPGNLLVLLCRQLDLFGRELLAVDGTRIKAVNNKIAISRGRP